jgi:hypothetical protein
MDQSFLKKKKGNSGGMKGNEKKNREYAAKTTPVSRPVHGTTTENEDART